MFIHRMLFNIIPKVRSKRAIIALKLCQFFALKINMILQNPLAAAFLPAFVIWAQISSLRFIRRFIDVNNTRVFSTVDSRNMRLNIAVPLGPVFTERAHESQGFSAVHRVSLQATLHFKHFAASRVWTRVLFPFLLRISSLVICFFFCRLWNQQRIIAGL